MPATALLLALCSAAPGCADDAAMSRGAPPEFRVPVTVALVVRAEVVETVELVGDVVSHRRAALAFERAGRVVQVLADLGDAVPAGTLLARLDGAVLAEQLAVAEAGAEAARLDAEYAVREAKRFDEVGDDLVRESERDRVRSASAVQALRAEQSQAEVRRLREVVALGELRAPFDAVVTARQITEGSHVLVGEQAFELVDLTRREVHLELPTPVAARLEAGAPLHLSVDELPDFGLDARLDLLVPAADPETRTFTGVVRLGDRDPDTELLPGLFARATLELARVLSPTVVPGDAVREGGAGSYVVVAESPTSAGAAGDGEAEGAAASARLVPVRVLARGDGMFALEPITPGDLETGDRIVVTGVDNAFPGAALTTYPHGPADGGAGSGAAATAPGDS